MSESDERRPTDPDAFVAEVRRRLAERQKRESEQQAGKRTEVPPGTRTARWIAGTAVGIIGLLVIASLFSEPTGMLEAAAPEARQPSDVNQQQNALDPRKVYYRIETNCASGANLTFTNEDGNITQRSNQGNDWYYGFVPHRGQFLSILAQNNCGSGFITVKVVRNGRVLEENTSTGAYVIADVNRIW